MNFKENFSLKDRNTFGVEAKAKFFSEIESSGEIPEIIRFIQNNPAPVLVLGEGSNVLFTRDFDGYVLQVRIGGIHVTKTDDRFYWIKAGAGVKWDDLVKNTLRAGMAGLENLSMIPGTVGAAPVQNVGAYGVEIRETLEALEAYDLKTGEKRYFRNRECRFGYRDSIFKNKLKGRFLISSVVFRLNREPVFNLTYRPLREKLYARGQTEISADDIRETVMSIRREKLPDPAVTGNAGSFFKNPVIETDSWETLKKSYPDLPGHSGGEDKIKISAAWLIDRAGWKGKKRGRAAVHEQQPLVLVNTGGATGEEILELSKAVQDSVKRQFGIQLVPEVRIL